MKKSLFVIAAVAALFAASCTPQDPENPGKKDGKTPEVTITADKAFAEDLTANVTVTLSEASDAEVVVRLKKADPQSGKKSVSADFEKKIKFKAGETTVTFAAKADVLGIDDGEYQAAIKIDSAEGATVAEPSVVYIDLNYTFKAEVNLYADASFAATGKASVKVAIAKATAQDIKVALEVDASSTVDAKMEKELVIKAGQTEAETFAVLDVATLQTGNFIFVVNIKSIENGVAGGSKSVTINLQFPFSSDITIDGDFDDWADALCWEVPAETEFTGFKCMKLAASAKRLFVYFEINEPRPDDFDMFPMPIDIFIDCDANVNTGGKLTSTDNYNLDLPFTDSGLNWYVELGNVHDGQGYTDFTYGAYKYEGDDGAGVFSKLTNMSGKYGASECFGVGILGEDGIGRIEIMFDRTYFELVNTKASVGAKVMNGMDGWNCWGLVPFGAGEGPSARQDLATIELPVYSAD